MPSMVSGTWNQTEVEMGPPLWGEFFLDPIFTEVCYEFANNQTALDEIIADEDYSDMTFNKIEGTFVNDTAIAVFDWALDFQWVNGTLNTDYGGTFRWKIAFDQTTGWMKGWRLAMDYGGTVDGTLFNIVWDQLVQQSGYTLGAFAIGTGLFPGFEWFIALPALTILGAIAVIVRKRK